VTLSIALWIRSVNLLMNFIVFLLLCLSGFFNNQTYYCFFFIFLICQEVLIYAEPAQLAVPTSLTIEAVNAAFAIFAVRAIKTLFTINTTSAIDEALRRYECFFAAVFVFAPHITVSTFPILPTIFNGEH
jgi:hypothetical protein